MHIIGPTEAGQLFAGIDWGGSFHQLCVLDEHGRTLLQCRIGHDVAGFAELDDILAAHQGAGAGRDRARRGPVGRTPHALALPVYCVSPKISARARERYRLAAAKSDAFDAFVLADTLRHEHTHWRPLSPPSRLLAEIKAISRDRERVIDVQHAAESRLRAIMDAYHPGPLHLFSSLDRDISLAFITDYPTPEQAGRVGPARMAAFCSRHGYSGRTDATVLVDRLRPHLLTAGEGTVAGKAFSADMFTEQVRLLNAQLRAYDARPAPRRADLRQLPRHRPSQHWRPARRDGRRPRTLPRPALCWPRPASRRSPKPPGAPARSASATPPTAACVRPSTGGPSSPPADDWSRTIYEHARRAAGQGKYRALRGLGARWTRILWRCWTDHATYDPNLHHRTAPTAA